MAQQQAPDDIFALYCRFDLDVSQYQVFERGSVELHHSKDSVADLTIAELAPAIFHSPVGKARQIEAAQTENFLAGKADKSGERAGLRNLLSNLHQLHDRSMSANFAPPCQPITVLGSGGGVGVTTVMATLARQLSKLGLRCGLYDDAAESILPLFFGFQRIVAHRTRFAGLHSVLEPSVRLFGADSVPPVSTIQSGELTVRDRLFQSFGHELDFLIADQSHPHQESPSGTTIFVALPDVASLASLRNFVSRTGWRCKNEETICVLNRFDPGVALHRELLPWYQEQFAQVVTVRHSFLVPESLAEGTSVLELAPESDVTADFTHLAACVRQTSAKAHSTGSKRSEGVKTQTEGLALCS